MKHWIAMLTAAMMLLAVPAIAQKRDNRDRSNTRSVQGVVTDSNDNLLERAVVQLKDTKTLQIRSFITKGDGAFHFYGLNPEVDYELKADHEGKSSDSKTLSSFDSRKQAVMNLRVQK